MNILITGGAGFIGSHLTDLFTGKNHNVSILDHFSKGKPRYDNPKAKKYKVDILNLNDLTETILKINPKVVYHLAAKSQIGCQDEKLMKTVNIEGTKNVIKAVKKSKAEKIIFSSSAAVYGDIKTLPIRESVHKKPISFYGKTKLEGEKLIRTSGIPYTIHRFSNVYGPRQIASSDGGVVSIFLQYAVKNKPLVIFGSGKQSRDMIYYADIISALEKSASKKSNQKTMNISSNTRISIDELAQSIVKVSNSKSKITYINKRVGDINHSQLDNTTARTTLGWKPKYTLEKGLEDFYDQIKS